MGKLDLIKTYKSYYTAKAKPELVAIEAAQYLSITGQGDPSEKLFAQKIQVLYATAYALKFSAKAKNADFAVAKLEGLWTFDEEKYGNLAITEAPQQVPRCEWHYRLLIRVPPFITEPEVQSAIQTVLAKKQLSLAHEIQFFHLEEGTAVQMLHVGPFHNEPDTLKQMQTFLQAHDLHKNGLHHEIYLSDFNKTAPEKLRTILREPVKNTA